MKDIFKMWLEEEEQPWGGWNTQAGHPHIPEALRQGRTLKQEESFQAHPGTLGFGLTQFIMNRAHAPPHTHTYTHNSRKYISSFSSHWTSTHSSSTEGTGDEDSEGGREICESYFWER